MVNFSNRLSQKDTVVGLATGTVLPEGLYFVTTPSYGNARGLSYGSTALVNVAAIVWSTPWNIGPAHIEMLAAAPSLMVQDPRTNTSISAIWTRGVGTWDPTFSANAAGGAGYTAAAFIVLIGFYAYAFPAGNLGGYPFETNPSPTSSYAQWLQGAFLTMIGTVALIYPNFNAQMAAHPPISLPTVETAQLGVCIVICSLICGLIFAPLPATTVVSRLVRTVGVTAAGIIAYVAFMRFFATSVLHFPAIQGAYGGNPLLWIDWMILLVLWHAVAFGGYFSTRSASK